MKVGTGTIHIHKLACGEKNFALPGEEGINVSGGGKGGWMEDPMGRSGREVLLLCLRTPGVGVPCGERR